MTQRGSVPQSGHRAYQCHSGLAGPGDWTRTATANAGIGSAARKHCSDGWGRAPEARKGVL